MFLTLPSCRGRRYKFTGENPANNRRPTCPHAPPTALPTRAHSHHAIHASSSPNCLQLNRVDPPRHQQVSNHANNSAQSSDTTSDQSADTSAIATSSRSVCAFTTSANSGPGWLTCLTCHLYGFGFNASQTLFWPDTRLHQHHLLT